MCYFTGVKDHTKQNKRTSELYFEKFDKNGDIAIERNPETITLLDNNVRGFLSLERKTERPRNVRVEEAKATIARK